jgi:hypothetical protein
MITVIKRATIADYMAMFPNMIPGWVVYHGGERVAIAGVNYNPMDDRWWAYLNVVGALDHDGGLRVIREMRDGLRGIQNDVYVLCDEGNYLAAPRLLRVLGFEKTNEQSLGQDVWIRRATEGE